MKTITRHLIRSACTGALLVSAAPWLAAQTPPAKPPAAAPPAQPAPISSDQASYLFGLTFGEQLHSIGIGSDVTAEGISRGLKEGLSGKKATTAERQQIQEYVHSVMLAASGHNKTAAQDFLGSNGKKAGVHTTPSGLEYKIDKAGDTNAPAITAEDEVTVNYRGKLLDGSEFDSSYAHGMPATFPVSGVIKGWQEALVLMKPGAKWTLYVPPDLAYGPNPRPGIPGNSLLIFDVDVLSVKPRQAAPMPQRTPPAPPKEQ
ncbi:MAG TPA: FKBP-type peptidyl-prolyl cis-trans isomerase [Steroidobacteraceae bacterium]|jgi:FKBP-type peptidyl-prolyl cis-trans isomerase|nr:FKBP-type peptidyl-prolyl cis-trans isomerase [Steroidobacteraceae bacterium]